MTNVRAAAIPWRTHLVLAAVCLAMVGCRQSADQPEEIVKPALAGTQLQLLVVDDPPLAEAIQRLQGEWSLQSGAQLSVRQATATELAADGIQADAAIVPEGALGPLVESQRVVPLPPDLLDSPVASWNGILDLVRTRVVQWGDQVCAAPLGSPQLVCYCRADLLESLDRQPPATWTEYQELAELLAEGNRPSGAAPAEGPWSAVAEPLAPGWAGLVLLSRAASYAKHRENFSTIFDIDTMEPLIASPPFVRALDELVAAAKLGPADVSELDPDAVRRRFWRGECALALTWPTAAADIPDKMPEGMEAAVVPLPGSVEVFRSQAEAWESRIAGEPLRVPLVGLSGRLGVVSSHSAHPEAAAQLLLWLASDDWSDEVARASASTTLFRRIHLQQPGKWVEPPMRSASASQYAEVVVDNCQTEQWFDAPRIPGRADYLAALDAAVARAVRGEASPAESLSQAASEWQSITDRLGRDAQKQAYARSLGLSP